MNLEGWGHVSNHNICPHSHQSVGHGGSQLPTQLESVRTQIREFREADTTVFGRGDLCFTLKHMLTFQTNSIFLLSLKPLCDQNVQ